jgi:hypothetical protein
VPAFFTSDLQVLIDQCGQLFSLLVSRIQGDDRPAEKYQAANVVRWYADRSCMAACSF